MKQALDHATFIDFQSTIKPIAKHHAIDHIKKAIDLNSPQVEIQKKNASTYFGTQSRHSHVHELLLLKIGDRRFLAKGEDVLLRTNHPNVLDYSDFYSFTLSMFELGEYTTPIRTFYFPEEPEIKDVTFSESEILTRLHSIRRIKDHTSPSSIQDTLLRRLFILYLSRKERLLEIDGQLYENVFNHHGRDILNEVIASILAKLLNIKIPNNYFGIKSTVYRHPPGKDLLGRRRGQSRYVLSELLTKELNCPSLDVTLSHLFHRRHKRSDFSYRFPNHLTNANPLGIRHFTNKCFPEHQEKKNLILSCFPHFPDLIYSDFFDKLLGGWKDRKLQEYLLPQGQSGPIYTVDYGEILFPEIEFERDDPHYLIKRNSHIESFIEYLDTVAGLPQGNLYKKLIAHPLFMFMTLPQDLFRRLIDNVPPLYFQSHWDETRYSYNPKTLIDFFERINLSVSEWLEAPEKSDSNRLYCTIERLFS